MLLRTPLQCAVRARRPLLCRPRPGGCVAGATSGRAGIVDYVKKRVILWYIKMCMCMPMAMRLRKSWLHIRKRYTEARAETPEDVRGFFFLLHGFTTFLAFT